MRRYHGACVIHLTPFFFFTYNTSDDSLPSSPQVPWASCLIHAFRVTANIVLGGIVFKAISVHGEDIFIKKKMNIFYDQKKEENCPSWENLGT